MEGGRPEDKSEKERERGGGTQSSSQNGRTVKDSDEGGFGRPVNCNWEEGGPALGTRPVGHATELVGGGRGSAVRAKDGSHGGQDECRLPQEIFQWRK